MHEHIRAWLDQATPSYPAGLALLASTGYDQTGFTWGVLQRGADSFTRSKLRALLTTALTNEAPPPVAPSSAPVEVAAAPVTRKPNPAIARLLDERFAAKVQLRSILDEADKAEQRRVLALRIKDITDELDRLYKPEAFAVKPPKEKKLTLINVRSYVSRYRKRTREHPDNAEYAQLLTHYETLLKQFLNEKAIRPTV